MVLFEYHLGPYSTDHILVLQASKSKDGSETGDRCNRASCEILAPDLRLSPNSAS